MTLSSHPTEIKKTHPWPTDHWWYEDGELGLSQSKIKDYLTCRFMFWLKHVKKAQAGSPSQALTVGGLTHYLLAEYYRLNGELSGKHIEQLPTLARKVYDLTETESQDYALEAAQLVHGYISKYSQDELEIIAVEQLLDTERQVNRGTYTLHGVIDAIAKTSDGREWQFEHKTTGRYDELYLRGLREELQGRLYHYLLTQHGYYPYGILYNLLVKKKVPQYERQAVLVSKSDCERVLLTFDGVADELLDIKQAWPNGGNEHRETELALWFFYPNMNGCVQYNRECPFKSLCRYLPTTGTNSDYARFHRALEMYMPKAKEENNER